jgi:hypothetical protein
MEKETKKSRHQVAHSEHALTHHTLASQGHLASFGMPTANANAALQALPHSAGQYTRPKPGNWASMSINKQKLWRRRYRK